MLPARSTSSTPGCARETWSDARHRRCRFNDRPERHEATTYPWVSIERVRAMADAVGLTITEELTYPMAETAQYHD